MKKLYLLLIGVLFLATTAKAQDVIVRKDGTTVLAKVEKVGEATVEYRKWDNQEGPIYTISIANILSINYGNGSHDSFESAASKDAPVTTSGGISAPEGNKTTTATASAQTQTATTAKKSDWYRDEKWFMMNSELLGVRIGLEGEGYLGATSSAVAAWNLGRFFHAGFGFEFYTSYYDDKIMVNIFGDVCWYVLGKKKVTPFLDYRVGLSSIGGLYLREAVGMAFGNFTLSTGVSFVGMIDEGVPAWDFAFGIYF